MKRVIIFAFLAFIASACGGLTQDAPPATKSKARVSLVLPQGVSLKPGGVIESNNPKLHAATITGITLSVNASDITTPITGYIPLDTLMLSLDIPSGLARTFTVAVTTDTAGSFSGSQTVDLAADAAIDVAISVTVVSIPAAPTGVSAASGNGQAVLSWTAVTGADSYNVYYGTATGVTTATGTKVASAASGAAITGLTNGTTYYFVVTAMNAGGESAVSSEVSATPAAPTVSAPSAPTGVSASAGNAQATISWTAVTGADSYSVYYGTVTGVTTATGTKITGATSGAAITGLTNGTTYYFVVTAMNAGGESAVSSEVFATPAAPTVSAPSAPTGVSASAGNAQATVSWTAVTGAASYNVYYSATAGVNPSNGTPVVGATSGGAITGLVNGTTYYFVVTAVNAGGEGPFSTQVSATPQVPAPDAPTGVGAAAGDAQATVSWTAVTGAASYNVYYGATAGVNPSNGTPVVGATSGGAISSLTNGTTYYFVVTAVNAGGEGAFSTQVSVTPQVPAPAAPGLCDCVGPQPGNGQAIITWAVVTGATSYNIYYSTASPVTSADTKVNVLAAGNGYSQSSTVTGLTNGTLYYFSVSAVNAGGESALYPLGSATPIPPPATPTGVTATSGNSRVTISWNAVSGATHYYVYWSTSTGVTGTAVWVGVTSYTHTPLANGIPHYYKVTAGNAGGEGSAAAEVRVIPGAGVAWAPRTSGIANTLYSVAWGNATFVAVSAEGTGRIRYSYDGIIWSAANVASTNLTLNALYNIVWVAPPVYFRSVGAFGTHDYSYDGITWYSRPQLGADLYAFASSSSMYVAVGQSTALYSSPTTTVWTARTDPTGWGYNMLAATWGGTQFVTGGVAGTLLTSPDGITWTYRATPSGNDIKGIAWSGTQYVAVITFGGIITSPDGVTWTSRTSNTANSLNAVNWNGTQFLAVGAAGTILTSPDGITWTIQTSGTANALNGITWDGTQYVVVGSAGTILVSNSPLMGGAVQKQLASGGVVTTFAGAAGVTGSADGTGAAARFNWPDGITTDGTNFYVADTVNNTIRQVVISTGVVTTLAGSAGVIGSTDSTGTLARFNNPRDITTDGTNLYVVDGGNHTIRQVVISTGVVTTLAGSAGLTGSADGTGVAARFNFPEGITTDGTNLYVADGGNKTIRKIVISTGVVTTLAGTALVTGSADGTGAAASFSYPKGITTDGTNLYVADFNGPTIRKVVIATGVVTTLAGTAGTWDVLDGTGAAASFYGPDGITTDGTNLYVTDYWNHNIRKIVISSAVVTTLAGPTTMAQGSTDGTGTAARFKQPYGITTDGTNLYVMDTGNHTIRKIQ